MRLLQTKTTDLSAVTGQSEGAEAQVIVADVLRRLPEDHARAIVYYYIDELSQAEVAELMGCSRRHVGNLLSRARELAQTEAVAG